MAMGQIKTKPARKLKHTNAIPENFECFCQTLSKLKVIILSYAVSKLVRFLLRHSIVYDNSCDSGCYM